MTDYSSVIQQVNSNSGTKYYKQFTGHKIVQQWNLSCTNKSIVNYSKLRL